ncbi:SGNH hydrolase-type esterase domain containing protein [Rhypophila decipiens]
MACLKEIRTRSDILNNDNVSHTDGNVNSVLVRRDDNPADFGWIKRWAAIGDSFTAGIGSGHQLGSAFHNKDDWKCSRYDESYPMVLNAAFRPSVNNFQFVACSGDRTGGIYDQANKVSGDLDLVIMTAGGQRSACVFMSYDGEDVCQTAMNKAKENIGGILKPNIRAVLDAINPKMKKDSIIVYNGYAQFFNTDEEDVCAKNQDWGWARIKPTWWGKSPLPVTVSRRKAFNSLVIGINDAIRDVVNEVAKSGTKNYWIGFSDWDKWAWEGVRGQFCDPMSSGYYPDDKQPDLQFFKPNTHIYTGDNMELKKRDDVMARYLAAGHSEEEAEEMALVEEMNYMINEQEAERAHKLSLFRRSIYASVLYNSPNPRAEVLHQLNPRAAPSPPGCPSDGGFDPTFGLGLPDMFAKMFHPNEKGHITVASYAVEKMMQLRARVLGKDASCSIVVDEFRCHAKDDGSRGYASGAKMNENYRDFCDSVKAPANTKGWNFEKTYHQDTPDQHTISIDLSDKEGAFVKEECLDAFYRITNGCDDDGSINPLWWKGGGFYRKGERTYAIDIKRTNRPWPPPREPHGDCDSKYKVFLSSFFLHGGGWATDDFGQALKKSVGSCIGSTPTSWKFWYYDEPDKDGNEWAASMNTPIWYNARCFDNNKSQRGAGGFTDGCKGSG